MGGGEVNGVEGGEGRLCLMAAYVPNYKLRVPCALAHGWLPRNQKIKVQKYHTNTTFLTTFPKRIKKVVNTTPIPVKYHH